MRNITNKLIFLLNLSALISIIIISYLYSKEESLLKFVVSLEFPQVQHLLDGLTSLQLKVIIVIIISFYLLICIDKKKEMFLMLMSLVVLSISFYCIYLVYYIYYISFPSSDDVLIAMKESYFYMGLIIKFNNHPVDKFSLKFFFMELEQEIKKIMVYEIFRELTTVGEIDELIEKVFNAYVSKRNKVLIWVFITNICIHYLRYKFGFF